jgi:hypothetical protein
LHSFFSILVQARVQKRGNVDEGNDRDREDMLLNCSEFVIKERV